MRNATTRRTILENLLLESGTTDQSVFDQIRSEVTQEVEDGAQYALDAPYPDLSEVEQHVYAE